MNTEQIKKTLIDCYIDYINNFPTRERYAEYYGLDLNVSIARLEAGKMLEECKIEIITLSKEGFEIDKTICLSDVVRIMKNVYLATYTSHSLYQKNVIIKILK